MSRFPPILAITLTGLCGCVEYTPGFGDTAGGTGTTGDTFSSPSPTSTATTAGGGSGGGSTTGPGVGTTSDSGATTPDTATSTASATDTTSATATPSATDTPSATPTPSATDTPSPTSSGTGTSSSSGGSEVLEGGPGLGGTIPDGAYDGSLGSMLCTQVSAASTGANTVGSVEVSVGLDHEWLGDLVIKLVSPGGKILTLLSRAGIAEGADDGAGATSGGRRGLLAASDRISFADGAAVAAEEMGAGLAGNEAACRDDGICDYSPSPDSGPGTDLADFAGDPVVGTWQLCVGDSGNADTGTVDYVGLTIVRVP